jgi:hypothetical protein
MQIQIPDDQVNILIDALSAAVQSMESMGKSLQVALRVLDARTRSAARSSARANDDNPPRFERHLHEDYFFDEEGNPR